jgi:sugar lactone lactonase YvrE
LDSSDHPNSRDNFDSGYQFMKKNYSVRNIFSHQAILGECPLWDPYHEVLYWIDIIKPSIHRLNVTTKKHQEISVPKQIGCIGLYDDDNLICALSNELVKLNPLSNELEAISSPLGDREDIMFNDGHYDSKGRFWVGTKDIQEKYPKAPLFCLQGRECREVVDGFTIINGVTWSPDNSRFYLCDSPRRLIYQYDFDPLRGTISNQTIFAKIAEGNGYPDGLAVDSEGFVWNAHYNGWQVTRYTPDGEIDNIIPMPVQCPTDCCFGGQDMTTLFITSARHNLTEEELKKGPLAGELFAVETDIQGLPPFRAKG